jgi:peptidyl-prolyl cis-trans isomerase C
VTARFAALIVATALAAACQKTPAQPAVETGKPAPGTPAASSAPAPAAQQAVKPVPAQLPEVIARVNGDVIPRNEFERALANLESQAGGPVPPERRDVIYRQVLDQLVAFRLLTQESAARKVPVPDTEIDARIGQIRGQFPNEQAYTAALAERGMTPDKLREDIRHQIAAMKLVETTIVPTVNVGEPEIEAFYKQNPERFQEPEAVHAAHILIRAPEGADAAAKQKARTEAQGVLASARKKGADFAALAKQHSQDQSSAVNGGDLGFVTRGRTVPAFEQAAFALKPGELSGVVESPFGFHVIKAFERRQARTVPLAEVKGQVGEFLKQQQVQEKTNALVGQLKAKGKVEILI